MYRLSGAPCVHVTPYTAKSLCAIEANKEKHRFAVGTCDIHDVNQIQLLEYVEDRNKLELLASYSHPHQIRKLVTSPKDESIILTSSSNAEGKYGLNMYKLPDLLKESYQINNNSDFDTDVLELSPPLSTLKHDEDTTTTSSSIVNSIAWNTKKDTILTLNSTDVQLWNIGKEKCNVLSQLNLVTNKIVSNENKASWVNAGLAWDPHSNNTAAMVYGADLNIIDTHNMKVANTKKGAHKFVARDVDYNPNKPMTIITCGHDRTIRIWDLRNLTNPVKTLSGHTHWATSAKYNPFHDQLILSGGSDYSVNLWRIASCSSSPWVSSDQQTAEDDPADIKVKYIDQHEESLYSVAWSAVDAWSFCSLSLDGRIIVNQVPTTEKYKILL